MPAGNRRLLAVVLVAVVALVGALIVSVSAGGTGDDALETAAERREEDRSEARSDGSDDDEGDRAHDASTTSATTTVTGPSEPAAVADTGTTPATADPGRTGAAGGAAGPSGSGAGDGQVPTSGPCTYGQPLSGTTTVAATRNDIGVTPGGVGLVVGHSNGVPVGNQFVALARAESSFPWVNAAQSGIDAAEWARRARWAAGGPVEQALRAAGHERGDVQVVLLAALSTRATDPRSPTIGAEWTEDLLGILASIEQELPSARAVYVTGPISHAYQSPSSANAEPSAYRHGQGVIDAMNRYRGRMTVIFGPYLWNDPTCPRTDGLHLRREHLADDIHPNDAGARYLAGYMVAFFRSHPTSRSWW